MQLKLLPSNRLRMPTSRIAIITSGLNVIWRFPDNKTYRLDYLNQIKLNFSITNSLSQSKRDT